MEKYLEKWLMFKNLESNIYRELEVALASDGSYPVKLNEFYVLYFLSLKEIKGSRLQELGAKVGLSDSAMSRMLVKMESKTCGVIKRSVCLDDKRGVHITLTPKGEEILTVSLKTVNTVLKKYSDALKLF